MTGFVEYVHEIYSYRQILIALVKKNLIGRYRNSVLGVLWNFVTPFLMLFMYYLVFTQIRSTDLPNYWLYLASGIFSFNFMLSNLNSGSSCIISNSSMIKKIYFPREIIVFAQILSSAFIMVVGYILLLAVLIVSGMNLTLSLLLIIPFLLLNVIFVTGYTLLFSAISVYSRDVLFFINSIAIVFFFVTPLYFCVDSITGFFEVLVWVNPFSSFVMIFHDVFYYGTFPTSYLIGVSITYTMIASIAGSFAFYKLKRGFAERV